MPSKLGDYLQNKSLATLKGLVPVDCPLLVGRGPESGFFIVTPEGGRIGPFRYEVATAFIKGYTQAWLARQP